MTTYTRAQRLWSICNPGHPSAPTVQVHYQRMAADLMRRLRAYDGELSDQAEYRVRLCLRAMRRDG